MDSLEISGCKTLESVTIRDQARMLSDYLEMRTKMKHTNRMIASRKKSSPSAKTFAKLSYAPDNALNAIFV
jgi:hypothetical protein